jgi:hypothetical protein
MIETDAPGPAGEMYVDLVPGPADLIETSDRGGPPPGTIRARITEKAVEISGAQPIPIEPLRNGISVRWEFALSAGGIQVWRNGNLAGVANVVPTWTEATPLFEFTGPPNGLTFVAIDAIGLSNAGTPPFVPPPRVSTAQSVAASAPVPAQLGGQLRLTIRSSYGEQMPGPFTVELNGGTFPLRPSVPGQQFESGLRYPVVADVPAAALMVSDRNELGIKVHSGNPDLAPQVQHADIELIPDPAHPVTSLTAEAEPIDRPRPVLATATAVLLDAAGGKIENSTASPRGRVVLDIALDGSGIMAGLAGVEIWVDDKRIAGLPANHDGPGITGHWRVALNTGSFAPGVRNVELKLISVDGGTQPQFTTVAWHIPS